MSGGKLIVLEGIDGAGTTTQTELLAKALTAAGHSVHQTREPSDGPIGRLIREYLRGDREPPGWVAIALLFAADRADHCRRDVSSALIDGKIVISDRWTLSSLAYQANDAYQREWVRGINTRALVPDVTLYLDVQPAIAATRRMTAGRVPEMFDDLGYQKRIARNYLDAISMMQLLGARIEVLDGDGSIDTVAASVLARVQAFIGEGQQ